MRPPSSRRARARDGWEVAPLVGVGGRAPFEQRALLGLSLARHVGGAFAIDATWCGALVIGERDWLPIYDQSVQGVQLLPDLARLQHVGQVSLQYTVVHGQMGWGGGDQLRFDAWVSAGAGFAATRDDLHALQAEADPYALATEDQVHPSAGVGGGVRIWASRSVAVRLEARWITFVETFVSTTLETQTQPLAFAAVSYRLPAHRDR